MIFKQCECYKESDGSSSESDGGTEEQELKTFEDLYREIALNCFRYLDFKSFEEVDRLTIPEYTLLMEAQQYKQVDNDYRQHLQAYLNFAVKAEKKAGKNKTKPVYNRFKKFYDYEKAINDIKNKRKIESKFTGLSKFLKKGD